MTREEAINILTCGIAEVEWAYPMDYAVALDMAIEALEQEPIIHCKNCKHWHEWENETGACRRSMIWVGTDYDDYCSFAEPKGSDEQNDENRSNQDTTQHSMVRHERGQRKDRTGD